MMSLMRIICTIHACFLCLFSTTLKAHETEKELFTRAFRNGSWKVLESYSGLGSSLVHTKEICSKIPELLKCLNARTILDAGCGDWNWMKEIDLSFLEHYYGVDIVEDLIEIDQKKYGDKQRSFDFANVITDPLPCVDVIICRSVLPLMYEKDILATLANFQRSGSTYLLVSTYPQKHINIELPSFVRDSIWARPINLQLPPFNLPAPLLLINEKVDMPLAEDKSLGLWRLSDLPDLSCHLQAVYEDAMCEQTPQA